MQGVVINTHVNDGLARLLQQFQGKPNWTSFMTVFLNRWQGLENMLWGLAGRLDITSMTGQPLTDLAGILGISRQIVGIDLSREFFAWPRTSSATPGAYIGFAREATTEPGGYFARITDVNQIYAMNDSELHRLIQLRIMQRNSNYTLPEIYAIVNKFFNGVCTVTEGNHLLTYAFTPDLIDNFPKIAYYTNSLPRPAGISITVTGI